MQVHSFPTGAGDMHGGYTRYVVKKKYFVDELGNRIHKCEKKCESYFCLSRLSLAINVLVNVGLTL